MHGGAGRNPNSGGNADMKKSVVVSLLAIGLASSAFAAEKYFVTVDTVGNCTVLEGPPSAGQTALGQTGGYDSKDAAETALKEVRGDTSKCKGVVE
jgi:hypothetical protein